MSELYPDPIAEPVEAKRMPLWLKGSIAVIVSIVLLAIAGGAVFFVLVVKEIGDGIEEDLDPPHGVYASEADRRALLTIQDFPGFEGTDVDEENESLDKLIWQDGAIELEYSAWSADEASASDPWWFVDASINEYADEEEAHEVYVALMDDFIEYEGVDFDGDESQCCVEPDSESEGDMGDVCFVGRRGTRVVSASWSGTLYAVTKDDLEGFLEPILVRMAEHPLER